VAAFLIPLLFGIRGFRGFESSLRIIGKWVLYRRTAVNVLQSQTEQNCFKSKYSFSVDWRAIDLVHFPRSYFSVWLHRLTTVC